jgi:hypothetical protein
MKGFFLQVQSAAKNKHFLLLQGMTSEYFCFSRSCGTNFA